MLPRWLCGWLDLNVQLIQLRLVHGTWSPKHQVLVTLGLRKCNHVADVFGAREHHHNPINTRCDASVRWNTVLECIQKVTKSLADGLL